MWLNLSQRVYILATLRTAFEFIHLPWGWSVSPSWGATTPVRAVSPTIAATLWSKGVSSSPPVPPPVAVTLRRWAVILRFTSTFTSDLFFYFSDHALLRPHSVHCNTHMPPLTLFFWVFMPDERLPNKTIWRFSTSLRSISSSDSVKLRFFPWFMFKIWSCREGNPRCRPYLN